MLLTFSVILEKLEYCDYKYRKPEDVGTGYVGVRIFRKGILPDAKMLYVFQGDCMAPGFCAESREEERKGIKRQALWIPSAAAVSGQYCFFFSPCAASDSA